jgi:hypothetical protein
LGYSNHNQTVFILHINAYLGHFYVLVIFVVKMHILRITFIFWLYSGDTILIRNVLKLYFEVTILPRKSHCYFDMGVIGRYTRRQ